MKQLFIALSLFFPQHRLADAPRGFFGMGLSDFRMVLGYWGDSVNPIGAYKEGRGWLVDSECTRYMRPGMRIDLVKLGLGKIGTFRVERILSPSDEPPAAGTVYAKGRAYGADSGDPFSEPIIGIFDPGGKPPKAEIISPDDDTCRKIARDFLKGRGIKGKDLRDMFVSQIVKVDLEGDGVDEVFISVQSSENYLSDFWSKESGALYSYLLMRKLVNGKPQIFVLYGEQFRESGDADFTMLFKVAGFWDLDRDGVLEIVVSGEYYEGFGLGIYSFDGERFVFRAGWGEGA